MNRRPTNRRNPLLALFARALVSGVLLFTLLALAACNRTNETPATSSASALPQQSDPSAATANATDDGTIDDTEIPVMTLESPDAFPQADTPAPAATIPTQGDDGALAPLEVAQAPDCSLESDLDLAGYPELEATMGCAQAPAVFDPIGINEFGEGPDYDRFMLWFSNEDLIYVLLPDGSWTTYEDSWDESQPEFACNPYGGEPTSPPLPRRGFGKLWCSDPVLQGMLGPVPREERLCQHAVMQTFEAGRMLACFEDATVRYFQLRDDGAWSLDMQR